MNCIYKTFITFFLTLEKLARKVIDNVRIGTDGMKYCIPNKSLQNEKKNSKYFSFITAVRLGILHLLLRFGMSKM